jgi:hypothetical protein
MQPPVSYPAGMAGVLLFSKLFIFNFRLSQFERMRQVIRRQHKALATAEAYILWLHQFSTRKGPVWLLLFCMTNTTSYPVGMSMHAGLCLSMRISTIKSARKVTTAARSGARRRIQKQRDKGRQSRPRPASGRPGSISQPPNKVEMDKEANPYPDSSKPVAC